jgi:hypothetical protein
MVGLAEAAGEDGLDDRNRSAQDNREDPELRSCCLPHQ